jgi:pimeloyl-ACP methyl ester carboxylesterase
VLGDLPQIDVPVLFCCGRRDFNVRQELVVEYVCELRAPSKRVVWFEKSAHLPNYEEPAAFAECCKTLLSDPLC